MEQIDLLRRAEAAERTVDVLKKKVFSLYNGGTSTLHKQLEKVRQRDDNNRRKRELMEVRANELARYSATLELEVARRTEAIKTILDNVTFGFLIVSRDLVVQPECTRSCYRLFNSTRVEGEDLTSLLCLGERARLAFTLSVDQVFEDILPSDVAIAQLQRTFPMRSGATLKVDAGVLRGKQDEVTGLLLTISDITALEAATRESNNNRTLVSILKQREAFRSFLIESKHQLESARRALDGGDQAAARRGVHTIKGNSASYGLDDIVEKIHHIEDSFELRADHVAEIGAALRDFVRSNERVLEINYDEVGDEAYDVSQEQMSKLKTLIAGVPSGDAAELKKWTARVLRKPAWQVLGPADDFAQKLAKRLGKTIEVEIRGGETEVDVETLRPIFAVLTHLLRNAVDHGIEGPVSRGKKPPTGRVWVSIEERPDSYVITCGDDGRGIEVDELGERAVSMGMMTAEVLRRMTREERLSLVFIDGLSTARVTTSISGRGVGMSAVRDAVQSKAGKIATSSAAGVGTTFTIFVPKRDDDLEGP